MMSPAPQATNESRPTALIDVKKLETPDHLPACQLPLLSPFPLPHLQLLCSLPSPLFSTFTNADKERVQAAISTAYLLLWVAQTQSVRHVSAG